MMSLLQIHTPFVVDSHQKMSSVLGMGRLKALITLKEVNTSDVETRKNLHEQVLR